jgi:CRP-like cAMP-binding protein
MPRRLDESGGLRKAAEARLRAFLFQMARVPDAEWEVVRAKLTLRILERGQCLTRMGEVATEYAWVVDGVLRRFSLSVDGREVVKGFVEPGRFAGDYRSLLVGTKASQTVEAVQRSHLLVGPYSDFVKLYERHPCWQEVGRKLAEYLFLLRDQRESELLSLSATERYERFLHEHASLVGQVPQHQIASYLGVTPVSLSRLIARRRRTS